MANDISIFNTSSAVPAFLQQYAANNDDLMAHASLSFPTISIKGKVFTLVRDGERQLIESRTEKGAPAFSLNVILVKVSPNTAKAYYDRGFKEGEDIKPRCFSNDGKLPDVSVENPCSKSCATCPFNQFGSRKNADGTFSKGKACSDSIRIAVAAPDALDDPMMIRVPATSMKALGELGRTLARHKTPYQAVITKIAFDPAAPTPKLTFTPVEFVKDKSVFDAAIEQSKSDLVAAIVGDIAAPAPEEVPVEAPVKQTSRYASREEIEYAVETGAKGESLLDKAMDPSATFGDLSFDDAA